MKTTRREFVLTTPVAAVAASSAATRLSGFDMARRHPFVRTQPTPDFFEGMLLGNGDVALCITVRPDALGLHIGKSDVWTSGSATITSRTCCLGARSWSRGNAPARRRRRRGCRIR